MKKRLLALFLTLTMLFSVVPTAIMAADPDPAAKSGSAVTEVTADSGPDGTQGNEMPLVSGERATATITGIDGIYFFSYTPEITHRYTFYSVDHPGARSELCDSNYNTLVSTGGGSEDFRIDYTLTGGETYYFKVYAGAMFNGEIQVQLDMVHSYSETGRKAGTITYTCAECGASYTETIQPDGTQGNEMPLVSGERATATITGIDGIYFFSYTPEITHRYTFYSVDHPGARSELCDSNYNTLVSTGGGSEDFRIDYTLTGGETYYFKVYAGAMFNGEIQVQLDMVHSYRAAVLEATDTEAGCVTYTCRECDDSYTETIPVKGPYSDVRDSSAYYYLPVVWAMNSNITTGTDATHFSPDTPCTRAQIVTFLWRAAGEPEPENSDCRFTDVEPGTYYYNAVLWAAEQGITSGTTATTFSPEQPCTRSACVTFLWRYEQMPAASGAESPFTDVSGDQYYYDAVNWAVAEGITEGVTKTTFGPDSTCTRAQIVTFLYRDLVAAE